MASLDAADWASLERLRSASASFSRSMSLTTAVSSSCVRFCASSDTVGDQFSVLGDGCPLRGGRIWREKGRKAALRTYPNLAKPVHDREINVLGAGLDHLEERLDGELDHLSAVHVGLPVLLEELANRLG